MSPEDRCPWCDAALPAPRTTTWHVERCASCGVGVTRPVPDDAALEAAYGGWYRPDAGRFSGPGDIVLRRTRATLAARIDRIAPPGRVLDVGAGDGGLVRALRARGRDALGLERDARADHVVDGTVQEVDGGWAAIVFWHSLEHLRDAGDAVAAATERLAPGGVVLIAVPNLGSVQAQRFGSRWLALDLPRHVVHLDDARLTQRLDALGLSVERVSAWRGGQVAFGWLHGLVAGLPGHPDLYDAVRRPEARQGAMTPRRRTEVLAAAVALAPVALAAAAVEILKGHAGTTYVEARRPS
jgi:SAM-dependent methyltransferase